MYHLYRIVVIIPSFFYYEWELLWFSRAQAHRANPNVDELYILCAGGAPSPFPTKTSKKGCVESVYVCVCESVRRG